MYGGRGIDRQRPQHGGGSGRKRAFTLVELLVVISIISLLMGISLPAFSAAKRKTQTLLGTNNQRQIVAAVNLFASDNDEQYPESVATVGFGNNWNWSEPTKLTGNRKRSPSIHRSMSAYLGSYVSNAGTMSCPCAPGRYKYLQEAWDAGDEWDNPETTFAFDPVGGTYCFYWNYKGCLDDGASVFYGPRGPAAGGRYSKLVVSDYFGYAHWRSPTCFGSCNPFKGADITEETWLLAAYWSGVGDPNSSRPRIELQAGYTDGHVETYSTSEVVPMKVSITADGTTPYPDGVGAGIFFLPRPAVR